MATKTLKVRVRDKHAKVLAAQARAVNFVWNYLNELSSRSIRERGKFLSAFNAHHIFPLHSSKSSIVEHLSAHSPCSASSEPVLRQQGVEWTVLGLAWLLPLIFLRALPYPVHPRRREPFLVLLRQRCRVRTGFICIFHACVLSD